MKKIRVAFFAEILIEDFDGASRTMFQLIKRINPEKYEFLFICGTGPEHIMNFNCIKVPAVSLPINSNYKMALPSLAKNVIKENIKSFKPHVIHIATPSLLGNFALKYAGKHNLPVITIYHTHFISYIDYYLKHTPFLISKVKKMVSKSHKEFYNQCQKIYVPSLSIKEELKEIGIRPSLMRLWKRGIDLTLFSPEKGDAAMLRKLTGNDQPTIIFASRLVWEKNLETLFHIYDLCVATKMEVNFLIAGDGTARKACEIRMKNAVFTGKVDHQELAALYASSTLFLFPSISETYGNVVIEAMASGLPCIIADGGGSKDLIEQGVNGYKCNPYDAGDYIAIIQLLLSDTHLYNQIRGEGLKSSKECDWNQLAPIYFRDIDELAGKSN